MLEALEDYPAIAVVVLPPYYFKPATAEGLVRFYEPVLAATRLPVIVYHIPKYAVPVPEEVLAELPVNFIPEETLEMHRKVEAGDETGGKALSEKLQEAWAMTKEYASATVLKKLAEARHAASMGTVRPPFVPAPADYDPEPALAVPRWPVPDGGRRNPRLPASPAIAASWRHPGATTAPYRRRRVGGIGREHSLASGCDGRLRVPRFVNRALVSVWMRSFWGRGMGEI